MKVAVQDNLGEIKNYLAQQGYEVVSPSNSLDAAAIIITGDNLEEDKDKHTYALATSPTITTYAPVINAKNKSPEEVLQNLEETINNTGHA